MATDRRPTEKRSAVVVSAQVATVKPNSVIVGAKTTEKSEVGSSEGQKYNKSGDQQQKQRENIENDQLMQRLRHIQQDIRQRRGNKTTNSGADQSSPSVVQPTTTSSTTSTSYPNSTRPSVQQQAPVFSHQKPGRLQQSETSSSFKQVTTPTSATSTRPSIQAAKSLDLQYYPIKQSLAATPTSSAFNNQITVQPKSAAVRVLQSNEQPPVTRANRLRLIRSVSSTTEPPEEGPIIKTTPTSVVCRANVTRSTTNGHSNRHTLDGNNGAEVTFGSQTAFKPVGINHQLHHLSLDVASGTPMRSTYF